MFLKITHFGNELSFATQLLPSIMNETIRVGTQGSKILINVYFIIYCRLLVSKLVCRKLIGHNV